MTGPEECRANAAQCVEMANNAAANVVLQSTLYDMAATWLKFAARQERADATRIQAASAQPTRLAPASSRPS